VAGARQLSGSARHVGPWAARREPGWPGRVLVVARESHFRLRRTARTRADRQEACRSGPLRDPRWDATRTRIAPRSRPSTMSSSPRSGPPPNCRFRGESGVWAHADRTVEKDELRRSRSRPSRRSLRQRGAGAPVGAPALAWSLRSEPEPGAGGHHRHPPHADGGDDLLGIDPLQVDRRRAEVGVPELPLDDVERAPSRASSSACAWRS
jgi:hypothetical protein